MTDDNYSTQFAGQNHQLAILPDETVVFYAYGSNGCDDIKERAPSGTVKTIVNSRTAAGTSGACHVNNVQYSRTDDTIVFSDLDHDNITKVTRTGTTVWVLGGSTNQFGSGGMWSGGQHGIHVMALDKILIFNNNSSVNGGNGDGDGSIAAEYTLNLTAKTATRSWFYKASSPRIQNDIMGDVQRLDNGNTFMAASTKSQALEISASGTVVQTWTFPTTFGYIEKRATLYGPPPQVDRQSPVAQPSVHQGELLDEARNDSAGGRARGFIFDDRVRRQRWSEQQHDRHADELVDDAHVHREPAHRDADRRRGRHRGHHARLGHDDDQRARPALHGDQHHERVDRALHPGHRVPREPLPRSGDAAHRALPGQIGSGTVVDFSMLTTTGGQAFTGIDDTGTWLIGLECGNCGIPAPWYLSVLKVCGTGGVTCASNPIIAKEANNYQFTSVLKLTPTTVMAKAPDLTINWGGVTKDFLGHTINPL